MPAGVPRESEPDSGPSTPTRQGETAADAGPGILATPATTSQSVRQRRTVRAGNRDSGQLILGVLALILLVFVTFMPALTAGLVGWDDDDLLVHEERYTSLTPKNASWMFTTSYTGHFQPLTWLSYWLDYTLWGREHFGYHLTSVVLHGSSAIIAFFVFRRLLRRRGADRADHPFATTSAACAGAAFFAVHPLRAESVAWLAERRDVLSATFYLLSVWFYLRFAEADRTTRCDGFMADESVCTRPGRNYVAMFSCCALSLLAKASAVTLPLVLLLLDAFPLQRMRDAATGRSRVRRLLLEKAPLFLICGAAGIRAIIAQADQEALYPLAAHDLGARLSQAAYGWVFYLRKTLWPVELGPLYPLPPCETLMGPMLWVSLAVLVACIAVCVGVQRRAPAIPAAMAFYTIQVVPVLGFFQSGPQLVADRYSYLPSLGFAVLLAEAVRRGARAWIRSVPARKPLGAVLGCTLPLVVLMHATFDQCDVWLSPLTLWRRGVQVSPQSSIAHVNYGDALKLIDATKSAIAEYQQGLALNPTDAVGTRHLGVALYALGELSAAAESLRRAIDLDPIHRGVSEKLAMALARLGQPAEGADVLRDRLRADPVDMGAAALLAELLATYPDATVRNGDEAERLARLVSDSQGGTNTTALMRWATALAEAHRFDESITIAERALRMARDAEDDRLHSELQRRLQRFRNHEPYHFRPDGPNNKTP